MTFQVLSIFFYVVSLNIFIIVLSGLMVFIGMVLWLVYVFSPFIAAWSFGLMVTAGIIYVIAGLLFIPDVEDREEDFYDVNERRKNSHDYEDYRHRSTGTPEQGRRIQLRSDAISPYPRSSGLAPPNTVWMGY